MAVAGADLEGRVEQLDARVHALEERLEAFEKASAAGVRMAPRHVTRERVVVTVPDRGDRTGDVSLAGQSLIAVGGAYLLRAITEAGVLPQLAGVIAGLAYAGVWLYLAHRRAAHGRMHAAAFCSIVAAVIAYPLLWEATTRFHSFPVPFASVLMLALTLAFLAIAWRNHVGTAAWFAAFGSMGCAGGLALVSGEIAAPMIAFAIGAAATWIVAARYEWVVVAWPGAAASFLFCLALQFSVARIVEAHDVEIVRLGAVASLLVVGAIWVFAASATNLLLHTNVRWADMGVAAGAFLFALMGAARLAAPDLTASIIVASVLGAMALLAYVRSLHRPPEVLRSARYFGALGVAATVVATATITTPSAAGILWVVFAMASIVAARMSGAAQFVIHGALYAAAAIVASGLLAGAMSAITGVGARPPLTIAAGITAFALTVGSALALVLHEEPLLPECRAARICLLSIAALVLIGGTALVGLRLVGPDAGSAAAVRSGVIAFAAVAIGLVSRTRLFSDASMLVYPVLGLGAAKFVVDDFMSGRAATLFVTLALYGCALLVLARLRRTAAATPKNATA